MSTYFLITNINLWKINKNSKKSIMRQSCKHINFKGLLKKDDD